MDTDELTIPSLQLRNQEPVKRERDLFKEACVMEDGMHTYALLGIEDQSYVHYAAPVKNMLYDVLMNVLKRWIIVQHS